MLKCFLQFPIQFIVRFRHDRVPEIEIRISEHSVFPLVYVQVRQ